jgi:hypothetical protein
MGTGATIDPEVLRRLPCARISGLATTPPATARPGVLLGGPDQTLQGTEPPTEAQVIVCPDGKGISGAC